MVKYDGTKYCSMGDHVLPVEEFNKNKYNKDGLQSLCRACQASCNKRYYRKTTAQIARDKAFIAELKTTEWPNKNAGVGFFWLTGEGVPTDHLDEFLSRAKKINVAMFDGKTDYIHPLAWQAAYDLMFEYGNTKD